MKKLSLSIRVPGLVAYVVKQLNCFFPDDNIITEDTINTIIFEAINRLEQCFQTINLPYYRKDDNPYFNHLHGDHYSSFLYILSRQAYLNGIESVAAKLFLLNKALFGIDAFYAIQLPESFVFVHPIGTILGRANYSNFFVVYQGVTIGANADGVYPAFSEKTILFSNSSIIGDSKIGSNFIIGAKSSLINSIIPDNKVVVGNFPNHNILTNTSNQISNYFYL
jgi:serine O-acetyltransferase